MLFMANSHTTKEKAIRLLSALSSEGRQYVKIDSQTTRLDPELTTGAKTARTTDLSNRATKIYKLINTLQALLGSNESGTFTEDELETLEIYTADP